MSSSRSSLLAVVLCLAAGCYQTRDASLGDLDDSDSDFDDDDAPDGGARDGGRDRDADDDDRRDGGYRWLCAFEPWHCY